MKKNLIIFVLTVFSVFSAHAQTWVSFSSQEPKAPQVNLFSSNASSVHFEVAIPGIFVQDTVVNGVAFSRLILSGGEGKNPAGNPELPILQYSIAIPDCEDVKVEYRVVSKQNLPSCWVYPVPEMLLNENEIPVEQFFFNAENYAQPRISEPKVIIVSTGTLRAQRYAVVIVDPIEFCPVNRTLSVINKIEIAITPQNPQGALQQNIGIFNKVASAAFINYEDTGVSALINDKAFEKTNFVPGNVQWITLTDTAQAKNIVADYLIICAEQFFTPHNADLQRLAEHRAYYNGFDVAILNVENILALPFYYEGYPDPEYKKEQRMRTCIRRIYEGAHAQHTGDGKLGYVLLVGDNYTGNTGMPTSKDHNIYAAGDQSDQKYPSDFYFSCVTIDSTGKYDDTQDIFLGRFSVENNTQLFNMVQKTLNHETEYTPTSWRKSAGFTYAENFQHIYNSVYTNYVSNLVNNFGWNCSIVDMWIEPNYAIKVPTINYLHVGTAFVQYFGACSFVNNYCANSWYDELNQIYFSNNLQNGYKAPFINDYCTCTGHFDDLECLGEFLTRYDSNKGAVGYIGLSRSIHYTLSPNINENNPFSMYFQERLPYYLFKDTVSIAGELLMISKIHYVTTIIDSITMYKQRTKHAFNLFGDPALNIMAKGYEITRNFIAECPLELDCKVRVRNGAILTIPDNCTFNILSQGQLIIEEEGGLHFGNNTQIVGTNGEINTPIYVKGGSFILGSNVVFQNIDTLFLDNNLGANIFTAEGKPYILRDVTFNHTPLMHRGTKLMISNCTFNSGSNVNTVASESVIDSCTFYQTTAFSDQGILSGVYWPQTTVSNSNFIGNGANTAIEVNNSRTLEIWNNNINGYEKGIALNTSGATTAYYYGCKTVSAIHHNTVLNSGTGIELYNSILNLCTNYLLFNNYGVRLFNNSTTSFGRFEVIPSNQTQLIHDNHLYQLFASENSFPALFRYNKIENAFPNTNPRIYWDVDNPYLGDKQDINYNCWGDDFDPEDDLYPQDAFLYEITWCPGKDGKERFSVEEELYKMGLDYFANEDYNSAETVFKELVENYPNSRYSIAAMHELFSLEHFLDNDFYKLHSFYSSFTPIDCNLFEVAEFLATRCYVKVKDWQPAINWYESRIENPPSYPDSVFAVIDLGAIHLMMEADTLGGAKSGACYYRMVDVKPKSEKEYNINRTTLLATLPQINKPQEEDKPQEPTLPVAVSKGSLGQNIPNPFNGTTTISYSIITSAEVEIKFYNTAYLQ